MSDRRTYKLQKRRDTKWRGWWERKREKRERVEAKRKTRSDKREMKALDK